MPQTFKLREVWIQTISVYRNNFRSVWHLNVAQCHRKGHTKIHLCLFSETFMYLYTEFSFQRFRKATHQIFNFQWSTFIHLVWPVAFAFYRFQKKKKKKKGKKKKLIIIMKCFGYYYYVMQTDPFVLDDPTGKWRPFPPSEVRFPFKTMAAQTSRCTHLPQLRMNIESLAFISILLVFSSIFHRLLRIPRKPKDKKFLAKLLYKTLFKYLFFYITKIKT